MGCFSWYKVDDGYNVQEDSMFKMLIPEDIAKDTGVDCIKDEGYQSYGYLGIKDNGQPKYDIYELLAVWNRPSRCKFTGEYTALKEIDEHTDHNRGLGVNIACYDREIARLKYPLRLVNYDNDVKYEDFDNLMSVSDVEQGWSKNKVHIDRMTITKVLAE